MSEIMSLWERLRRRRREGRHADVINRDDPRLDPAVAAPRQFPSPDSVTCPQCGMISYNLYDIREGYCANCHTKTSPGVR